MQRLARTRHRLSFPPRERGSAPVLAVLSLSATLAATTGCHGSTGPAGSDGAPGSDAATGPGSDAGDPPATDAGPDVPPINDGFIGGACDSDADCAYAGGYCIPDADGFSGGLCSAACDLYCPDQDGAVTTFCVDPADLGLLGATGLCITRCDYGVSDTGCRAGWQCVPMERNDEPWTLVYACVPGDDMPFELSGCHEELIDRGVSWTPGFNPLDSPMGYPNLVCDVLDPVWVAPTVNGVSFRPGSPTAEPAAVFTSCELALSLERTAALVAPEDVTDIVHYGTYNCRTIAGTDSLSQHGLANAIDIAAVVFGDGTSWSVYGDWEDGVASPVTAAGTWLRWMVDTLYDDWTYNIILTPEYNAAHDDHFHCDLTPGEHFLQ